MVKATRKAALVAALFFIGMSAFADEPEELPLQSLKPKKTKVQAKLPPPPVSRDPSRIGLVLAPKFGAVVGLVGQLKLGVSAAAELGYRLPVLKRTLGFSIEPTFHNPSGDENTAIGTSHATSLYFSLPILVTGNLELGPGMLRVLVGPDLDWLSITTTLRSVTLENSGFALGLRVGVSYGFFLGPGTLGLEIGYRYLPYAIGQRTVDGHALVLHAMYAFLL
jgi:hypothetical protein